jgi:hypothetical protein
LFVSGAPSPLQAIERRGWIVRRPCGDNLLKPTDDLPGATDHCALDHIRSPTRNATSLSFAGLTVLGDCGYQLLRSDLSTLSR